MTKVTGFFEQGGGLSDTLSHFELRPSQVTLVEAIDAMIEDQSYLIAEAGTGIGKTFSYLLPTLANRKQIFVSTATKHLQEQIFYKDLPIVEKVLGRKVSSCLLKGRSNYFCHYRYEMFLGGGFHLNKSQLEKVSKLQDWLQVTKSGDLSEVAEFVEEDYRFQKQITSTRDNCIGGECPHFENCFVQKVREKAKKSEVVVVNHALLMADIVLKQTGFAEILPEVDVVVIDEAHHLPKIATEAFADQVSSNQMLELAKDSIQVYRAEAADVDGFEDIANAVITVVKDFCESLGEDQEEGQIQLGQLKEMEQPYEIFKVLMQSFKQLLEALLALAKRSDDLAKLSERAELMAERIKMIFAPRSSQEKNDDEEVSNISAAQSVGLLEWREDYFHAARLPIHLGYRFQNVMQSYADSWLFVSATLCVGKTFDFFINSLGLPASIPTLKVDSPFNYEKQSVIHVFPHLPEPNDMMFIPCLVEESLPVLDKTKGRAFMLFTSYRNLYAAAKIMRDSKFNLFIQGEMPKSQLIDAFMKSKNAVLLGTVSFWEGVDISGEKLSCVIIDKIPFPSPSDPIIAEQSRYLEEKGLSSFAHCYVPKAATLLKQGAGRLIRSANDTGVLIFGDGRILRKSYGKQLIASMPPAKQVDSKGLFEFIEKKL
ncbi:MAG: ATP-dependent DNA helicase [Gammaproteobacteria bacterium]|nr:ATP-dependent DNA helicase [Gammaproteobacteria bacterium]